eukprot:8331399-Pyramimonas_sp.AAC.1
MQFEAYCARQKVGWSMAILPALLVSQSLVPHPPPDPSPLPPAHVPPHPAPPRSPSVSPLSHSTRRHSLEFSFCESCYDYRISEYRCKWYRTAMTDHVQIGAWPCIT